MVNFVFLFALFFNYFLFISLHRARGGGGGGGGGVLPYMGYIGMCRGIGYVFSGSQSLNRVSFLVLWHCVPGVILR